MRVLLMHLLKWTYQANRRSQSWRNTIIQAWAAVDDVLVDSPSLHRFLDTDLGYAYGQARKDAAQETGLPLTCFSEACPYTLAQIMAEDFWPLGQGDEGVA
ncbi:MAG: DUF29 domain-containing protein [Gloeomargaritaceae cyanobacterium C42_A2020_066]|nr:DUF29 domain-containing protein [Gloeomargaritaceae cyanobacterium C42_A2020_066]